MGFPSSRAIQYISIHQVLAGVLSRIFQNFRFPRFSQNSSNTNGCGHFLLFSIQCIVCIVWKLCLCWGEYSNSWTNSRCQPAGGSNIFVKFYVFWVPQHNSYVYVNSSIPIQFQWFLVKAECRIAGDMQIRISKHNIKSLVPLYCRR